MLTELSEEILFSSYSCPSYSLTIDSGIDSESVIFASINFATC
jgi:hypothetical protein